MTVPGGTDELADTATARGGGWPFEFAPGGRPVRLDPRPRRRAHPSDRSCRIAAPGREQHGFSQVGFYTRLGCRTRPGFGIR
jgi:hypothetical protein